MSSYPYPGASEGPKIEEVSESEFLGKSSRAAPRQPKKKTSRHAKRRSVEKESDVESVSTARSSHSVLVGAATAGLATAAASRIPTRSSKTVIMYWVLVGLGVSGAYALALWYLVKRMKRMEETLNDTLDALLEQEEERDQETVPETIVTDPILPTFAPPTPTPMPMPMPMPTPTVAGMGEMVMVVDDFQSAKPPALEFHRPLPKPRTIPTKRVKKQTELNLEQADESQENES